MTFLLLLKLLLLILSSSLSIHHITAAFFYYTQKQHTTGRATTSTKLLLLLEENDYNNNNGDDIFSDDRLQSLPRHLAIILDGNARWAQQRQQKPLTNNFVIGHQKGADQVIQLLENCKKFNNRKNDNNMYIEYLTLYCFSTENFKRPQAETSAIFQIIKMFARKFYDQARREKIRIKLLGDVTKIPEKVASELQRLEADSLVWSSTNSSTDTAGQQINNNNNNNLTLCLAVNYGARQDIVQAVNHLLQLRHQEQTHNNNNNIDHPINEASSSEPPPPRITQQDIEKYLSTSQIPDPDFIIRTGGEKRLSNFLLFESAYSEFYFTDTLWPDFGYHELYESLLEFNRRQRRYGGRCINYTASSTSSDKDDIAFRGGIRSGESLFEYSHQSYNAVTTTST